MKNNYWIGAVVVVVVIILGFVLTRKQNPVVTALDNNTGTASSSALTDGTYKLDTDTSTIKWSGDYVKGDSENGTAAFNSGEVDVASGSPFAGSFEVDMNSVKTEDNVVVDNYLKMNNFLAVDQYPTAIFKINKVIPNPAVGTSTGKYIVDGWLTIKDITKDISFPITISQSGNRLTGDSSFALNRTDWGVTYDSTIKNAVSIDLHIEATK